MSVKSQRKRELLDKLQNDPFLIGEQILNDKKKQFIKEFSEALFTENTGDVMLDLNHLFICVMLHSLNNFPTFEKLVSTVLKTEDTIENKTEALGMCLISINITLKEYKKALEKVEKVKLKILDFANKEKIESILKNTEIV